MLESDLNPELRQILEIVKRAYNGLSITEIGKQLDHTIPARTLLRRLETLIKMGELQSHGLKRGTRYYAKQSELTLPLTPEAVDLKSQVRKAVHQKEPVGYKRDFLYHYKPNESFYLTLAERKHLRQIGQQFNHEVEPGTYVKRILNRLLIDLSWNSSRLEGNTYSLLETQRLIEFGAEAEGKDAFEAQMIINHKDAIEFMVSCIDDRCFTKYIVLNIHALLSNNLLANPKARGQLRQIPVGIGRTVYNPPEIPQLIDECFQQILNVLGKINDPFEQALFAMVHLPYLQPFEDVNKRVSRLVANIPLIKHNLSPLSFIDVPKDEYVSGLLAIYELNRTELMRDVFIWAYERSAKKYHLVRDTLGEPDLFRMKYRRELEEIVNGVVINKLHGKDMIAYIQEWAQKNIPDKHQEKFTLTVEEEIASLHEGNLSVYYIKPAVFEEWLKSK